jgi:hypothetical protein
MTPPQPKGFTDMSFGRVSEKPTDWSAPGPVTIARS